MALVAQNRLGAANARSTDVWLADLKTLFQNAKDRFPDVVWELIPEGETEGEEVWGHKAVVYARAPVKFQALYFSFRPVPTQSPTPYGASPTPHSTDLLSLHPPSPSRSPSPFYGVPRGVSPAPSQVGGLLRLTTSINPALFSNELEYLYTGQGIGAAFEFLFDTPEQHEGSGDPETDDKTRIDKLRKDLCYMWRSRLFSDVRIALTGEFRPPETAPDTAETAAVFFSHRFILISRSPYFRGLLVSGFKPPPIGTDSNATTLTLPSTAFTPASLHWALGFMYTGTLNFSHRTFDLDTAFAIVRSAAYLSLATMSYEIEAHIVEEMMHGLFHAYLTFEEYEAITAGKWGVGGCRCRQCQRRAPRILEFALAEGVGSKILERGGRRALVGMFGEGWCSAEFFALSARMRGLLLKGVNNRTTPQNIFPLLFAAQVAHGKLNASKEPWVESIRDMILKAEKKIDEVLCAEAETCFEQQEWLEIMNADGAGFHDMEHVETIMSSIKRGLRDTTAAMIYQVLVSSILLRPHPTDTSATLLPNNSPIRAKVEETRMDVVHWLKKQSAAVRLAGGFDPLEPWALKELSHELEMKVEDLFSPTQNPRKGPEMKNGLHLTLPKEKPEADMEASSMTSQRVANRKLEKDKDLASSTARSAAGGTRRPIATAPTKLTTAQRQTNVISYPSASPASSPSTPKLIGATFSRTGTIDSLASTSSLNVAAPPAPSTSTKAVTPSRKVVNSTNGLPDSQATMRPKSIAASLNSFKSAASTSTIKKGNGVGPSETASVSAPRTKGRAQGLAVSTAETTGSATPRASIISGASRPSSRVSDVSTTFKTARSELNVPPLPRQRTTSTTSNASNTSTTADAGGKTSIPSLRPKTGTATLTVGSPQPLRTRKASNASQRSQVSTASSIPGPRSPNAVGRKTPTPADRSKTPIRRPSSQASVRSTVSTASRTGERRKAISTTKPPEKVPDLPRPRVQTLATPAVVARAPSIKSVKSVKGKDTAKAQPQQQEAPPPSPRPIPVIPSLAKAASRGNLKQNEKVPDGASSPIKSEVSVPATDVSSAPSDGNSTIRGPRTIVPRKRSNETITESYRGSTVPSSRPMSMVTAPESPLPPTIMNALPPPPPPPKPLVKATPTPVIVPRPTEPIGPPKGMTLNVGIPCIISSKRTRFRAFARYVGDVYGETGPWVGVEVPVGEFTPGDRLEGRDWHDGSWGGVRYFDIRGADWEDEEGRVSKRRKVDAFGINRKRDATHLGIERQRSMKRLRSVSPAISESSTYESRGLFVRPQQVLYVIDARADY